MKFKFENTFEIMQAVVRKICLSRPFQHSLSPRGGRPASEAFRQILKFIFGQSGRVQWNIAYTKLFMYVTSFSLSSDVR